MTWTPETKHTSTFTGQTKNTSTWDQGVWYLLQEIGNYILQENGDKLVLNQSWNFKNPITWTVQTKH